MSVENGDAAETPGAEESTPAPAGRRGSAAGDAGYTDLLGRQRVPKSDPRIEAIGALDVATSALGLARSLAAEGRTRRLAQQAQQDLYEVMAELAFPPQHAQAVRIGPAHVAWLDRCVATVQAPFAGMTRFVLPGGCTASGAVDVARAEVRTAERRLAHLAHSGQLPNETSLVYLNRLSLLLYYLARAEDAAAGVDFDLAGGPETRPEA